MQNNLTVLKIVRNGNESEKTGKVYIVTERNLIIRLRFYNWALTSSVADELRECRRRGDSASLMRLLSATVASHRDICGVLNEHIYSKTHHGTKTLVEQFVKEVCVTLQFLQDCGKI